MTTTEHAGTQRRTKTGCLRSCQMTGKATAARHIWPSSTPRLKEMSGTMMSERYTSVTCTRQLCRVSKVQMVVGSLPFGHEDVLLATHEQ